MACRFALVLLVAAACRPASRAPVVALQSAADAGSASAAAPATDAGSTVTVPSDPPDASAAADPPDAAVPAGPPDAAVPSGPPANWHCDGADASVCDPRPPAQSDNCRPPLEPALPALPAFDGGIPGACSEVRG